MYDLSIGIDCDIFSLSRISEYMKNNPINFLAKYTVNSFFKKKSLNLNNPEYLSERLTQEIINNLYSKELKTNMGISIQENFYLIEKELHREEANNKISQLNKNEKNSLKKEKFYKRYTSLGLAALNP